MPGNKKNRRKERQKAKAAAAPPKQVATIGHVSAGHLGLTMAVLASGIAQANAPVFGAEQRAARVSVGKIKLISGRSTESAERLYRRISKISARTRWSREDLVEEWAQRAYARDFPNPKAEAIRRAKLKAMG